MNERRKIWNHLLFFLAGAVMMGGILAAGGRYGRRDRVFSRGELERDHTLYFHNVTCKAETDV